MVLSLGGNCNRLHVTYAQIGTTTEPVTSGSAAFFVTAMIFLFEVQSSVFRREYDAIPRGAAAVPAVVSKNVSVGAVAALPGRRGVNASKLLSTR